MYKTAPPNPVMVLAYEAVAMLARLFRYGRLNCRGGFVNLRNGRTTPIPIDPRVWARMQGSGPDSPVPLSD